MSVCKFILWKEKWWKVEAVESPFVFFPLFSSLPMQGCMWLKRNGSSFNSESCPLLSLGSGWWERWLWREKWMAIWQGCSPCGAVAPWECLGFPVRRFLGWGILVRNVVIHTRVKPEQVEVLLVLGALSNGGKPLMSGVQAGTPCADSLRIL